MNEFEHDVQSKRNDLIDSGIGFIVAFVAFSAIFIIATIVDVSRWLINLMKKRSPIPFKEKE